MEKEPMNNAPTNLHPYRRPDDSAKPECIPTREELRVLLTHWEREHMSLELTWLRTGRANRGEPSRRAYAFERQYRIATFFTDATVRTILSPLWERLEYDVFPDVWEGYWLGVCDDDIDRIAAAAEVESSSL